MAIVVLPLELSEKIAAGEVVDRPASVVKELVENSIDAKATSIEVEIVSNGLSSIRITDNGTGIDEEDVKTAFLRHATSKVRKEENLYSIETLGFRGEALAAIAAVSKVKLITRTKDSDTAVYFCIEGGQEKEYDNTGADYGTTIIVSDIFYNTPARMKFLKKDVSEGNAVSSLLQQLALSHPEISFKFIRDKKTVFTTPGDGSLFSAIYSLLPREISNNLIEVTESENNYGIIVTGFIGKPEISRKSRAFQYTFVNRRYVKSPTIIAAVEQAFKSMNISAGFPAFVINVSLPYDTVDVNVHPAKTEVRFSNEHEVFLNVHRSVTYTLSKLSSTVSPIVKNREFFLNVTSTELTKNNEKDNTSADGMFTNLSMRPSTPHVNTSGQQFKTLEQYVNEIRDRKEKVDDEHIESNYFHNDMVRETSEIKNETVDFNDNELKIIGELFELYILASVNDKFIIIDKHAAHERILFEEIKNTNLSEAKQTLLESKIITVTPEEKQVLIDNVSILDKLGFTIEEFGENEIAVREIPMYFTGKDEGGAVLKVAEQLSLGVDNPKTEEGLWLLKSISCRAAIKAGHKTTVQEMLEITKKILFSEIPKYCPHGRNVYLIVAKQEIDKRFGR